MKIGEIFGNGMTVETYDNRKERDARGKELRKQGYKTHKDTRSGNRFELTFIKHPPRND